MHPGSMNLMARFRDSYLSEMKGCSILDVGCRVVKHTQQSYRELFEDYDYIGMDIEGGDNVDLIGYDDLTRYDVVISGQTMEHVLHPWDWLKDLNRHFKHYICIIAPNKHPEHLWPVDTYRYFPDGMRDLFDFASIKELEIYRKGDDTIGIGSHF